MKTWCSVVVGLLLMNAGLASSWRPESLGAERPNVVLFLVDDMGVMDTSVPFLTDSLGQPKRYPLNDFYRTPGMDRLAQRGVRFSNFCAMSVCSPTRISLLTGQSSARHRTTNWISPDADNRGPRGPQNWNWKGLASTAVSLPRLLRDAGYRTIHVGKGHLGPRGSNGEDPRNIGFDINIGGSSIGQPGSYYGEQNYAATGKKTANPVPHLEKYHGTKTFLSEALTLEAKAAVSQAVQDQKPFYLNFAHYAVHAPFQSDPRFINHYRDSGRPPAAQAFASLVEGMDKSLSDLLDHLEQLGVAENTLILFLGDNGSDAPLGHEHEVACAAPLRGRKGAHYEGGMRVPMIAAWARPRDGHLGQRRVPIAAGTIQTQLASVLDLFPTILAATGVEEPREHVIDGLPLVSLFNGRPDPSRPQRFLMHYPHAPHRSNYFTTFRHDDWKVIYHYFPTPVSQPSHYQLFNLADDPFESQDVADTEPKVLRSMMAKLIDELQRCAAVYPVDEHGQPLMPQLPRAE